MMDTWHHTAVTTPLIVFLLCLTGCSGCEDAIVQDEPDDPWILEEGELCVLKEPDEEFVQTNESYWSRVLPV